MKMWTTIGTAIPAQAVVTAAATDWEIGLKIANLSLGVVVAIVSIVVMVRKQILHELRNAEAAKNYQKRLNEHRDEQQ